MTRYIYAFDTFDAAREAIASLRARGVGDNELSLVARSDIQLEKVPDRYLDARTDFLPALGRGAAIGGVTGLFAGLIALAFPPLGVAIGGPLLLGLTATGATIGAWSSAMVGGSVPDEVRRRFEDEIRDGRTLVVVDSDGSNDTVVQTAMSNRPDPHLLWQSEVGAPPAV